MAPVRWTPPCRSSPASDPGLALPRGAQRPGQGLGKGLQFRGLARTYWAALDAWGAGGPIEMNVADPATRSHAVTAVRIGAPHLI